MLSSISSALKPALNKAVVGFRASRTRKYRINSYVGFLLSFRPAHVPLPLGQFT